MQLVRSLNIANLPFRFYDTHVGIGRVIFCCFFLKPYTCTYLLF